MNLEMEKFQYANSNSKPKEATVCHFNFVF